MMPAFARTGIGAGRKGRSTWSYRPGVAALEDRLLLTALPTSVRLAVSALTATYGESLSLTATVAVEPPGSPAPTAGTVSFLDNGAILSTMPVVNGLAAFATTQLTAGAHSLTVSYSGDGVNFASSATSDITTIAGSGEVGSAGDNGPATSAQMDSPQGVAVDAAGNVYFADYGNNKIREVVKATGEIITVAGNGTSGFSGDDGPATSAALKSPYGVAIDGDGNIYIADTNNHRIRMVEKSTGNITTVAGDGTSGYSGDGGPATSAQLSFPSSVAVDAAGNIFISDTFNACIREVENSTGNIITVAGTNFPGFSGDNGPATDAQLDNPFGLTVDTDGNIFFADYSNNRIREVVKSTGNIITVAGVGTAGFSGDGGPATAAQLDSPIGVGVDAHGDLYIADYRNTVVRQISIATGNITTVAGSTSGFSGDNGPATLAKLAFPQGLGVDAVGTIYISDTNNNRIRRITTPTIVTISPATLSVTIDAKSKVYGQANPALTGVVTGIVNGDDVSVTYDTTAAQFSDVIAGGYAITATGLSGTTAGNYTFDPASTTPGVLTVTPAPLTVVVNAQSRVYGQVNPALTGVVTGVLNGDDVTASYNTTAAQFSDVVAGGYAITLAGLGGAKAGNYSTTVSGASVTPGTLTITPAPLTVTVASKTKVYGQANPALSGVVGGILNGDAVFANFNTSATTFSDVVVGGYAITVSSLGGAKAGNYSTTVSGASVTTGTLTITPAPLTVTVDSTTKVYGQVNPAFTSVLTGVLNNDDVTAVYTTTAGQFSHVLAGGYPITVSGLSGAKGGNYSTTVVGGGVTPGTLTITQAPLTVSVDAKTKVYGQDNPALTGVLTGVVNNDDVTATYTTTAAKFSDVVTGGYPITLAGLSGAGLADYSTTVSGGGVTPAVLTITPAPLTGVIDSLTKVYGDDNPTLTGTVTGKLNGDDVSFTFTTEAMKFSHVGGYPITVSVLTGAKAANYTGGTVTPGTLTITPAPLQVVVNDVAKVYGDDNPTLTGTVTGKLNGDDVTVAYSTKATKASHVLAGGYEITVSDAGLGGAQAGNYQVVKVVPGILTINPASLTMTADNKTQPFGGPVPTLTVTYAGFVNGDTAATAGLTTIAAPSTTATASSLTGTYTILAGSATAADYVITPVSGTLTVQAATVVPTPVDVYVSGVHLQTIRIKRKKATQIVVSFSAEVSAGSASSLGNYRLMTAGRDKKFGTKDDKKVALRLATYARGSATLTAGPKFSLRQPMQLRVISGGIVDPSGLPLRGNRAGAPAGDALATLSKSGIQLSTVSQSMPSGPTAQFARPHRGR